jgi:PqqD family protein of HPr-rel-A system
MAGQIYLADPPEQLRRVELDGLVALFHLPSGMTHIVAPPAPQILDALGEGPADAAEILSRMSVHFDITDDADAVTARLAELEAVGLVRRQ